jgi:aldose 1-epimerase
VDLAAGSVVVTFDPEGGGRVTQIVVAGRSLLVPAGCFLMAPWAGRTGFGEFDGHPLPVDGPPHAIHGTVRGVAWRAVERDPRCVSLTAPLGPVWPWDGWCEHVVTVAEDRVTFEASVHAADGSDPFPAALGWHPWFVKPAEVELSAAAMLERGDDHLPTGRRISPAPRPGERPFDDCFAGVRWPVVLRWDDGFEVRVDADGCDHVVLYDEQATTTCVEPQTAPPDALRSGAAALVSPGRPLQATMRLLWR